jgi:hypothetical protein
VCTRPTWWCAHPEALAVRADCDGDDMLDWACMDPAGNRGIILSSKGCSPDPLSTLWPSAPLGACPAVFGASVVFDMAYRLAMLYH